MSIWIPLFHQKAQAIRSKYLNADGVYQGDVPLLGGEIALVQDGGLVGWGRRKDLAPGQTISQTFGVDPRIVITHNRVSDERRTEGIVRRRNTRERQSIFEVTNRHAHTVEVVAQDRLPVARDDRIEVSLTDESDKPDGRDVNDQPEVVEWRLELESGQTRHLRFGYRVIWPEDSQTGGL